MYRLKRLPYKKDYIKEEVYKYLSNANFTLGELKGLLESTNNINVIIRLINVYEALNSSAVEGVISDIDSILLHSVTSYKKNEDTKAIINYIRSVNIIYNDIIKKNMISIEDIHRIQKLLIPADPGIRNIKGHKIYNKLNNSVLYIPPQRENTIVSYFENLIDYINNDPDKYDPLIKMAIIHYQFECIHPYYDGNGRVGRIVNTISLVLSNRLNYPILNLSSYINETKEQYITLLDRCHNDITHLNEFVRYMLIGINETGKFTISFIHQINRVIDYYKKETKKLCPKIYSNELVLHLFKFPYTKNEIFRSELNLSRTTATKYLKELESNGLLESFKYGKEVIYKNTQLKNIF